jgi:hypothetical protein
MSNQGVNYQSVLVDLRSRRARLDHAIAAIEQIVGETESAEKPEKSMPSSKVYEKMTIGDGAVHFMRSKGKQQSTRAIADALKSGGISSKSKNLYTTTYNTLTQRAERKDSDIVKAGTEWALAEWDGSGPQS